MRRIDSTWFVILSELFVNLSAFWLAGAFVSGISAEQDMLLKLGTLTLNVVFAILSVNFAFLLRKRSERKER